jgi:hypothetical protein
MNQNLQVKKGGKFLPIVSIVLGVGFISSIFLDTTEKIYLTEAILTFVVALAFIGFGILSLRKNNTESPVLNKISDTFKYIIWIFFGILLIGLIPLIGLLIQSSLSGAPL